MTVHKPSIRLAGLYLAIIMAISLFFSANVYQLSIQELDRGLRRPSAVYDKPRGDLLPDELREEWRQEREEQYEQAKERVLTRLIVTNIIIAIGGGVLSYYLARRTLKPIEEAHEAQSRFTADASHELRTPIAAMQSEIEVALMDPKLTLTQAKAQLQSNLEELAKLTRLSEGLLRLARMENGELLQEDVSMDRVVQRALERVLPVAESKGMLIGVPSTIDTHVIGDEDSLVEAVVTILDNAVKYSPQKTQVIIGAYADRKCAVLTVQDQGVGIKATELPHIFERFYRADNARNKQVQGYGLGLAIAKNIIDAHRGSITVASARGKGTTFTIKLPLRMQ